MTARMRLSDVQLRQLRRRIPAVLRLEPRDLAAMTLPLPGPADLVIVPASQAIVNSTDVSTITGSIPLLKGNGASLIDETN